MTVQDYLKAPESKGNPYLAYDFLWRHNGRPVEDNVQFEMRDALSVSDAPMWMPKVIQQIVREAVEPLLVGTQLLHRINYSYGQTITFGALGAMHAADVAEGQEYPERQLNIAGGTVTCTVGKSGLAVKITDEMIRYSQYDVVGLHLRAAGRALARHKEQKIFNMIRSLGTVTHDNITPANSVFGVTTGRALDGSANGSMVMDNLFDSFAQIIVQGFQPNTLIMHPLTWTMFMKDAYLRGIALMAGKNTFFGSYQGNPVGRAPWDNNGGLGVGVGQAVDPSSAAITAYPQTINSSPNFPDLGFPFPFQVIVSPFIYFDPINKITDIIICDSNELGVLVVDEDPVTEDFDDPSVDIRKIKIRERYGLAILNEGQGVGVMKNVSIKPNQIVLPARTTIDSAGSVAEINPTTPTVVL
jgi:hypothetical protein